ncbi:FMN-dependent oxidoreductase, nitrilotriacetate monooxygenase family protein [Burkholderia thailandensis MSMB121]|uniref:LLM class flavin-dependent oxidoreductase n=1 Tax=Burkholderia humptydooensis TaxID=430531 RepID=UPI0003280E4F|nr:LLM class flavin-dependent oxidoreductase [Burkholderia humptydooensis]AGK51768.1 FMN-dependent oxidoreductase, nitrilotriacetate monooxygenase family protein [Burkholderia thailandensis MSMB121]ATF32932.1 FMN-dependent monooxygenase [Burkholderia thailandensis]KST70893.1 monooxygenase [Burkholderia humptydooensis]
MTYVLTRPPRRQLHLNVNILHSGFVPSAWRIDEADPRAFVDVSHYVRVARIAEAAKFDAVFLADNASIVDQIDFRPITALEPTILLAMIAAATTHIGLIGTASTSYNEPFNLARRFASLDHASAGRAGWNVVTTADAGSARNFGLDAVPDHAARYARAAEFVDVVKALWDSWDDDALVGDKASGRFVDTAKVRPIAHRGAHFRVQGPLNLPRPPQGHPVLVQAGGSADGRAFAARHAEAVFSASQSLDEALGYARELKAAAAGFGRDDIKVLPGLTTIVGATEADAQRRRDELIDLIPLRYGLNRLAGTLGVPVERLAPDAPLPGDLVLPDGGNGNHTFFHATLASARRHGYTVRELIRAMAGGGGHRVIVGTPEQIADDIAHWFDAGAADGFNLMPDVLPGGLQDFVDGVVPILRRRGLFRAEYEGATLRDHLGLSRPVNAGARERA